MRECVWVHISEGVRWGNERFGLDHVGFGVDFELDSTGGCKLGMGHEKAFALFSRIQGRLQETVMEWKIRKGVFGVVSSS